MGIKKSIPSWENNTWLLYSDILDIDYFLDYLIWTNLELNCNELQLRSNLLQFPFIYERTVWLINWSLLKKQKNFCICNRYFHQ